jgi:hypothetical protein
MRRLFLFVCIGACAIVQAGCAHYTPPKVDSKTGMYGAMASVAPGDIQKRETNVDLRKFRFVYLITQTNLYPARFEFFTRSALARMGFKNVLNQEEVAALVTETPELSSLQSEQAQIAVRHLSERAGPVLLVYVRSMWDGDVRRYVNLEVVDLSDGRTLLKLHHEKLIWIDVDAEAHYPVLNEFKKWADQCAPPKERS